MLPYTLILVILIILTILPIVHVHARMLSARIRKPVYTAGN